MALLERRIGLLFACFLGLLALAAGRALWLGTVKGSSLATAASSQQVSTMTVPARRGTLTDAHGVELAVSEPADDVSATPYLVKDPVRAAQRLAPVLGRPVDQIAAELARKDTGFVYLARGLPASQGDRISRLKIPGVALTPGYRRVYPRGVLASQVLGNVGTEGHGLSGLEYADDPLLRGRDGKRRVVRDALGQPINIRDPVPARAGAHVELTIDANIQDRVEQVLAGIGAKYRPKGATAFVMDPRTGALLALANWPRVDANAPLGAAPDYAHEDRAVGYTYEPGSTFKAFTVAGAVQDGTVTPTTRFYLPPQIQVADRTIHDAETRGPETLSTAQILAFSSNVGAITIGEKEGRDRFDYWVRRFAVTPMQMAQAYAAIANGGILRAPHIIRRIDGRPVPEPKGRRIISEETSHELRTMLEGVFAPGGTASEVSLPPYKLAGKTGTASKIDPTTGQYSQSRYIASFMGFAPALHPKLLIGVMVDEPQGAIYGGVVAAPAFGDIASFALQYLRIPPR